MRKNKIDKVRTPYVWANPRKCKACDKCIAACPEQVIGKVGFLWHKHILFRGQEKCSGCKKCIKVCPYGVFSEEMPEVFKGLIINN